MYVMLRGDNLRVFIQSGIRARAGPGGVVGPTIGPKKKKNNVGPRSVEPVGLKPVRVLEDCLAPRERVFTTPRHI